MNDKDKLYQILDEMDPHDLPAALDIVRREKLLRKLSRIERRYQRWIVDIILTVFVWKQRVRDFLADKLGGVV